MAKKQTSISKTKRDQQSSTQKNNDENDDDEKYVKAAKQSQRDLMGVLVLLTVVIGAIIYVTTTPTTQLSSSSTAAGGGKNANGMLRLEKKPKIIDDITKEGRLLKKDGDEKQDDQDAGRDKDDDPENDEQDQDQDFDEELTLTMEELQQRVQHWDAEVRKIRKEVDIFETDPAGQVAAKELQDATRMLLRKKYGSDEHHRYRVRVQLEFQPTISDFDTRGKDGMFVIEMAPSQLQPHSVYTFLEIVRQWQGGAFHRIAPHVLQVQVKTHTIQHLAFQEYSPEYPHKERTVGYAGRPSGPAWYVSIQNNVKNHGPGSQQTRNPFEADSCFGTVIEGYEDHVLRITKVAGSGFLGDAKKHVLITSMTLLVPQQQQQQQRQGDEGEKDHDVKYVEWRDYTETKV